MPQGALALNIATNGVGGNRIPLVADPSGAIPVTQAHGKYESATQAGRLFGGANQTGATLSAALAATYTGLILSNPAASGKNLLLNKVGILLNVAPAALTAIGLAAGWLAAGITVHTTALTINSKSLNSQVASVAKLDAAATLVGTPYWERWLAETIAATGVAQGVFDIDGAILIPPGGWVAIGASIAGPAAGLLGSMEWEEI